MARLWDTHNWDDFGFTYPHQLDGRVALTVTSENEVTTKTYTFAIRKVA